MPSVGLVVLTGGASSRMGRDKATIDVGGIPLAGLPVRALRSLVTEVVLAGRGVPGVEGLVVADGPGPGGPLAGVLAGCSALTTEVAVVVACDMPRPSAAVVSLLLRCVAGRGAPAAAVCASALHGIEPLPLVVRRAEAERMRPVLARQGSLREALAAIGCAEVEEAAWRRLDPDGLSFVNWNRPGDMGPLTALGD